MKYIIMADGAGKRWNRYMGIEKHSISVGGETLLRRTVRLLHELDGTAQVLITSHDTALEVPGAERWEPRNNVLEVDRFTAELIEDNVCFLYGDVYYTEETLALICSAVGEGVLTFGSEASICAIKVFDGERFNACRLFVREAFLRGEIAECKGWQVYHAYAQLPLEGRETGRDFINVGSVTRDFNCPEDYDDFIKEM